MCINSDKATAAAGIIAGIDMTLKGLLVMQDLEADDEETFENHQMAIVATKFIRRQWAGRLAGFVAASEPT